METIHEAATPPATSYLSPIHPNTSTTVLAQPRPAPSTSSYAVEVHDELDAVQPYSMHVSSRYLELTKKKLESTRLPREVELPEHRRWEMGVPKGVLEPLLDYWLEQYDWRTQESRFNSSLPQYRTTVTFSAQAAENNTSSQPLRIHFVHKRSKHKNAIPLLFCHTWPASFVEVQKIIDALTDPHSLPSFGAGAQQAFHVVAPSIPGFGFSDASTKEEFGLRETAEAFHRVMERLGYDRYVAHGSGWGFNICRALALNHSQHCLAVHTTNPSFLEPTFKRSPMVYLKHRIARWTRARISSLSFGYTPAEVKAHPDTILGNQNVAQGSLHAHQSLGANLSSLYALRPQTLAFSQCDSPIGLLAGVLDIVHTRAPSTSPVTSRSRSPFLSPVELELQDAQQSQADNEIRSSSADPPSPPFSPRESELNARNYTWSPTEVLNWTMLQWLPGPEASLRWLRRATLDATPTSAFTTSYCSVPLAISSFQARNTGSTPLMWGSASWSIAWVKRHQRPATISPAWEAPDLLVLDVRECFGTFLSHGTINLPIQET